MVGEDDECHSVVVRMQSIISTRIVCIYIYAVGILVYPEDWPWILFDACE